MQLSYLQFHAVFVVPVLLLLLYVAPKYGPVRRRRSAVGIAILVTIAFGYTTPWGSYMIQRGVWWYGDGAVLFRSLSIPLGEYLFFVFKTVLVGLYLHVRGFDPTYQDGDFATAPRIAGAAVGIAMLVGGLYLITLGDQYLYLGGLVAWVGPVVVIQWAVGGGYLLRAPRPWLEATLVPSAYLWITDRLAIGMGTWVISDQYTTGLAVLGLPIEEMLFFALAATMTATGLVLFEWVLDYNDRTQALDRYVPKPIMDGLGTKDLDRS